MKISTLGRAIGTVCAVMHQVMVGSMAWLFWTSNPWDFDDTVSRFADSPFVIIFALGFCVVWVLVVRDFLGVSERGFVLKWSSIQVDYPQGEMAPIEEHWYQAKYGPIDLVVEHYSLSGEWSWRVGWRVYSWQSGRAATADDARRDAEKFLRDQFEVTK